MAPINQRIYLASKSPRRKELLRQMGVFFELLVPSGTNQNSADFVDETPLENESPRDYVIRLSKAKAHAAWEMMVSNRLKALPIMSADTTVALGNEILGKPANKKEATAMLEKLSGKTHSVFTCVSLRLPDKLIWKVQESQVTFANLSEDTIKRYCDTLEPYDKAGGYGIQGKAATFISFISGSYTGIMGLPLYETTQLLREAGIIV